MHGYGVFSSDDLGDEFTGMPLEGSFHVYDSIEGVLEDVARDKLPRCAIGLTETLWAACVPHELVREVPYFF